MQWASALSSANSLEAALDDVAEAVVEDLGETGPDLLLAFVSPSHRSSFEQIPDALEARFPTTPMVGCSGAGVIGDRQEREAGPGLVLVGATLPSVEVIPFNLHESEVAADAQPPGSWRQRLGIADGTPHFILLPDPFSCHTGRLLHELDREFPSSTKVGGLVSGADKPGQNVLYAGNGAHRTGAVGVALRGNLEVGSIVAQGCRPVGPPLFVTRSENNLVRQLDGQKPADVLQGMYESLPESERKLVRSSLSIGLAMTDSLQTYKRGDFLIRNIIGLEEESGSLAVAALVPENTVVQFHVRDASTSAKDLESMLEAELSDSAKTPPAGALLFSCVGRGSNLYGTSDHDTAAFHRRFGAVPMGGFFCNGEVGPVQRKTYVHGYTSVFALFRRLHAD